MSFLHAWLLWFLPLLLLPILLHLFTLHRLRTVELSTFRFLFDSYMRQRRRMKFLESLLAALRALVVLLIVLLVSRPIVRHWSALFGGGGARDHIVLVDCSASMNAVTDGVSAMARARHVAHELTGRLAARERFTLVRVTSDAEALVDRLPFDAEAMTSIIDDLVVSPARADLGKALRHVLETYAAGDALPRVTLITDRQANGWQGLREDGLADVWPSGLNLTVVDVGSREPPPNRGVIGDAPSGQRAIAGLPVVLRPRVVNHAADETVDTTVRLLIGEDEVGRASFTLRPGETGTREIAYVPREAGVHKGRFEIDFDRFDDDNRFLFVLAVAPQVKVVLVNGNRQDDPLDDEATYIQAALRAGDMLDGEGALGAMMPGGDFLRALDVREVLEPALNPPLLADTDVVILANCGALSDAQFGWLQAFVRDGGGLLIFPGEKAKHSVYSRDLLPVPGPMGETLASIELDRPQGDPDRTRTFERLAVVDYTHPALSVFESSTRRYLTSADFYRRFPLEIKRGSRNAWPIAWFSDGRAALVEGRYGRGLVLVAGFSLNTQWSNLPLKPAFVPLVLRLVSYVQRPADVKAPPVLAGDHAGEVVLPFDWTPATGHVMDDAGLTTPLVFQRGDTGLAASFEQTVRKGFYTISVSGGDENAREGQTALAVNVAPEESDFTPLDRKQIETLLPGVAVALIDATSQAQQSHGSVGDEREVWRPLIALLFGFMAIEFLLATAGGGAEPASGSRLRTIKQWVTHES